MTLNYVTIIREKILTSKIYIEENDDIIPQKVDVVEVYSFTHSWYKPKKQYKQLYSKLIVPKGTIVTEFKIKI